MIGQVHLFDRLNVVNHSLAGSEIEVTLRRRTSSQKMRPVYSLVLINFGFVGRRSVGWTSGSWTLVEDVRMVIVSLYTHWHERNHLVTDIRVWITRTSGAPDVILHQDIHFTGIADVSNMTTAVMQKGDRLTVQCTINNTMDITLRIK